jgi:hypothetical protein
VSCGDTTIAWVPTLGAASWSGDVSPVNRSFSVVFTSALAAAVTVINNVPHLGTWSHNGTEFRWTAALEGFTWNFVVLAEGCDDLGSVTGASGTATDGNANRYDADMTRNL